MEKWEIYLRSPEFSFWNDEQKKIIIDGVSQNTGILPQDLANQYLEPKERENFLVNAAKIGMAQNLRAGALDDPNEFARYTATMSGAAQENPFWKDAVAAPLGSVIAMGPDAAIKTAAGASLPGLGPVFGSVMAGQSSGGLEFASEVERLLAEEGYDPTSGESMEEAFSDPGMAGIRLRAAFNAAPVAALDAASVFFAGKGLGPLAKKMSSGVVAGETVKHTMPTAIRAAAPIVGETIQQGALGAGGEAGKQMLAYGEIVDPRSIALEAVAEAVTGPLEAPRAYGVEFQAKKMVDEVNVRLKDSGTINSAQRRSNKAETMDIYDRVMNDVIPGVTDEKIRRLYFAPESKMSINEMVKELNDAGVDITAEELREKREQYTARANRIHLERFGITLKEANEMDAVVENSPVKKLLELSRLVGKGHIAHSDAQAAMQAVIEDRGLEGIFIDGIHTLKGNRVGGVFNKNASTIALNSQAEDSAMYSTVIHEMTHAFESRAETEVLAALRKYVSDNLTDEEAMKIIATVANIPEYAALPQEMQNSEVLAFALQKLAEESPKEVFDLIMKGAQTPGPERGALIKVASHMSEFILDLMDKFNHLQPVVKVLRKESIPIEEMAKHTETIARMFKDIKPINEADRAAMNEESQRKLDAEQKKAGYEKKVARHKKKFAEEQAKRAEQDAKAKEAEAEKESSPEAKKRKKAEAKLAKDRAKAAKKKAEEPIPKATAAQKTLKVLLDRAAPGHGFTAVELTPDRVAEIAASHGVTKNRLRAAITTEEKRRTLTPEEAGKSIWRELFGDNVPVPKVVTQGLVRAKAVELGIDPALAESVYADGAALVQTQTGVMAERAGYEAKALEEVLPGHGLEPGLDGFFDRAEISEKAVEMGEDPVGILTAWTNIAEIMEEMKFAGDVFESINLIIEEGGFNQNAQNHEMAAAPEIVDQAKGKKTLGQFLNTTVDRILQKASDKFPFINVRSIDQVRTEFQDRFLAVRRLQEMAEKVGIKIDQFTDVYLSESNMRGRQEHTWKQIAKAVIDPVNRKVNSLNLDPKDVQEFLLALRAPEYNLHVFEKVNEAVETQEDIEGSGISDGEALETLEYFVERGLLDVDLEQFARAYGYADTAHMRSTKHDQAIQFEAHKTALRDYKRKGGRGEIEVDTGVKLIGKMGEVRAEMDKLVAVQRDLLRDYGLMSSDEIKNMMFKSKYYVPMRGSSDPFISNAQSVGQFLDIRGKEVGSALGRSSKTEINSYSQLIGDIERIIIRGEKNKVGNRFYELVTRILSDPNTNPETFGIREIMTVTPKKLATVERTTPEGTKRKTMLVDDMFFKNRDNVFATKVDGVTKYIVIDSEELATAVKALGHEVIGPMMAYHARMQRFLARMSTSLNVDFAVANAIRDALQASAFAHTDEVQGTVREFLNPKTMAMASKAVYDFDRGGGVMPPAEGRSEQQLYWDKQIQKLSELGGRTGWMQTTQLEELQQKYEKSAINTRVDEKTGFIIHTNPIGKAIDLIETVTGVTETLFRVIAFERASAAFGTDPRGLERAAFMARNLTVDFNKRGNAAWPSMLYIFANASIQGTTRMLRAVGHNKNVQRLAMQLAGVSFGAAMWNRRVMGEDEWDAVPDYMKERSLLIAVGGGHFIEIPLPWGLNVFHVLGNNMEGMSFGNKTAWDTVRTTSTAVVSAFNPMGGTVGHSLYGTARNFVPTVPRIVMDIAANESWTGQPIHSKYGIPGAPGYTKGRERTSAFAREVAHLLNIVSLGNEVEPGFLSVYPEDIEYLMRNAFGGVGGLVTNTLKTGGDISSWFGDDPQGLDTRNIPMLRRVTAKYSPEYNLDNYFRNLDRMRLVTQKAEEALESGDRMEYARLKAKYPKFLNQRIIKSFKKAEKKRREAENIQDQGRAVIEVNRLLEED